MANATPSVPWYKRLPSWLLAALIGAAATIGGSFLLIRFGGGDTIVNNFIEVAEGSSPTPTASDNSSRATHEADVETVTVTQYATETATVTVTSDLVAPTLPEGGAFLRDLDPVSTNGSKVEPGIVTWRGDPPVRLPASLIADMSTCSRSPVVYVVPDAAGMFVAEVGITEDSEERELITFNVYRDGVLYAEGSKTMRVGEHDTMKVPVSDTVQIALELVTESNSNGCADVVAAWGNARFEP